MTIFQTKKNRKLYLTIAGILAILVIAVVLMSRMGFDKDLVKQKLDEYIAAVKERGAAQGRDIDITYGDLEVVGGLTSRHVIIHTVSATVKPSAPTPLKPGEIAKPESLTITTPEIALYPTAMDLSAMRISFTQPLNFAATNEPEKSLLKVSGDRPLDFTVAQEKKDNIPYIKIDHEAPGFLDLAYLREQQADGKEDATPTVVPVYDTLHVVFTPGSSIHTEFATDGSKLGVINVDFKQITMAPQSAPEGVITIAGIQTKWSNTLDARKVTTFMANANIGPITGPVDVLPSAPLALTLDATYVAQPAKLESGTAEAAKAQEPSTISLKKFSLTTKDASISATADFASNGGEILPAGKANITIVNVPFFRAQLQKTSVLKPENEGWVGAAVQQVTGTPFDQLKDVNIPITRDAGGSFKIGNSTLEEIVAMMVKQLLQQHGGSLTGTPPAAAGAPSMAPTAIPVPALPPAEKPKAAPIHVPDNGVRG